MRRLLLLGLLTLQASPLHAQAPSRYRPPTDADRASAYANDATREFIARAREARLRVDSSLVGYRSTSYERLTLSGSIGPLGRAVTLARRETVGEVTWSRGAGAHIALKGRRRVTNTSLTLPNPTGDQLVPVPWYPGMDDLWLPSSSGARGSNGRDAEADTTNLVHPLSIGSESYYTFSLGDSTVITLGDRRRIVLRELRARPRRPKWNLSLGSYWFDTERHQIVRAIYRLSVPYDVWTEEKNARGPAEKSPPLFARFLAQPLRGELQAVTLEYGLHEDRFWLPRVRRMDGTVKAGPAQLAVTIEQGFRFDDVNSTTIVPDIPAANLALTALYDSLDGHWQQLRIDRRTLQTAADSAAWKVRRATLDSAFKQYSTKWSAQGQADCKATGTRYQTGTRLRRAVVTRVAIPCDSTVLANAPELAGGLFAERAQVYGSTLDAATREALALDVQAAVAPQRITRHAGLEYLRYNRVEALSVGVALRQQIGAGWSWEANARGSFGDRQLNGEVFATRTNGDGELTVAGYRRLVQADDYGFALGPFASVQNFVSGLDEQFYHRAAGAEITRRYAGRGAGALRLETRLFGEWQQGVGTQAALSVPWLFDRSRTFDRDVIDTLPHMSGAAYGASLRLLAARGAENEGWRIGSAWRAEAVAGDFRYVRAAGDMAISRALPGMLRLTTTFSGGMSSGAMPTHRLWNIGGWQTLRGLQAGTLRGDAFWMTRAELLWARQGRLQPGVFTDAGWAGTRGDIARSRDARISVGGGVRLFGLPFRIDMAQVLEPGARPRIDLYAPLRF